MAEAEITPEVEKPVEPLEPVEAVTEAAPEVDHRAALKELTLQLKSASPSGVESIAGKMLEHLDAL